MSIVVSTDKNRLNIPLIYKFLSESAYWSLGRKMERIEASIENSMCFGLYLNEEQIGFARVVTDKAVFAWIMDVFIIDEFQQKGYGKELMANILHHEELKLVQKWGLATKDAHSLYEQFGFNKTTKAEMIMERVLI